MEKCAGRCIHYGDPSGYYCDNCAGKRNFTPTKEAFQALEAENKAKDEEIAELKKALEIVDKQFKIRIIGAPKKWSYGGGTVALNQARAERGE